MAAFDALIRKYAQRDSTILLTGESGVGKEIVARQIHNYSSRSRELFYTINCGAVPSELLCVDLFGAEQGSYTGLHKRRIGLLESAHQSTLLIDEIGELPFTDQPVLLRSLQEGEVRRIGSNVAVKVDVRIIAATNCDLTMMVRQNRFRNDLFQRLNVLHLHIPALRERIEDIEILLTAFLRQRAIGESLHELLTPAALTFLKHYPWPGNVRELENLAERLVSRRESGEVFDRPDLEALLETSLAVVAAPLPAHVHADSLHQQHKRRPGPQPKQFDIRLVKDWLAKKIPIAQICQNLDISRSRFYARPEIRALLGLSCSSF